MTIKLISQNKAVNCYLILILWIFLVIIGVYKFLEHKNDEKFLVTSRNNSWSENQKLLLANAKTKRILQICNFPQDILQGNEGIFDREQFLLKGLIILIRHGDRGPLQHVKNIKTINCNTEETSILKSYKLFLRNFTINGKLQWPGFGSFHGFPLLPYFRDRQHGQCQLGQLTMQGISQLLNLGVALRKSYREIWPKLQRLKPDQILIYSTRYRRTFQSVLAFLYGLIINDDTLPKLNILESQSMSFCFKYCECPITETFKRLVQQDEAHQLELHPAIETLAINAGKLLLTSTTAAKEPDHNSYTVKDPNVIKDALLAFICHNHNNNNNNKDAELPCDDGIRSCIKKQHVAGIMAYTEWMNYKKWKNPNWKRFCLLKSYGQIRHVVQQMLHIVSSNSPNLIIYSGHDFSILQLATALGLKNDPLLIKYASRLVFEIYQDNRADLDENNLISDENNRVHYYFRLLSNGKDVTEEITFCKNLIKIERQSALCKIEDIVRFLHDDYFSTFNLTNFKDACTNKNKREQEENDFFQF